MPAPALTASIEGKSRRPSTAAVSLDAKEAVDIAQGLDENVFLFVPNIIGSCVHVHRDAQRLPITQYGSVDKILTL